MSDFSWDDYENDDDLFGTNRNDDNDKEDKRIESVRRVHRMMFINDLELHRSQPVPLNPTEFYDLFGYPTIEDMKIITQVLITDYHRYGDEENGFIYDKWGLAWMYEIMKFNSEIEEYELSAIVRDLISDRPIDLKQLLKK